MRPERSLFFYAVNIKTTTIERNETFLALLIFLDVDCIKEKERKMNIIEKKVTEIIPYEKNPRRNDEAVDYVAN